MPVDKTDGNLEAPRLSKDEIIKLYWSEGLTKVAIAYARYSGDLTKLENDFKFHDILTRPNEVPRVRKEILKNEVINASGSDVFSKVYDLSEFSSMQVFYDLSEEGSPDSGLLFKLWYSDDSGVKGVFHQYVEGPWGYFILSEDVIPCQEIFSAGVPGKYFKMEIVPTNVTTLNSTNYFKINRVYLELS